MKRKEFIIGIRVHADNIRYAKRIIIDNNHIIDGISFIFEDKKL